MQVDKLVETKGLDYVDREKAKRHARQQAEQMYDQQHGNRDIDGGGGGNWGNVGQRYGIGSKQQHLYWHLRSSLCALLLMATTESSRQSPNRVC